MAPMSAPAPELGDCVMTGWLLHTWRGTATCCTTGVLEITRARMSMAEAGTAARPAAAASVERTSAFFMIQAFSANG